MTLNEDGTRLLRAFRADAAASSGEGVARGEDITTTELRIQPPAEA